MMGAQQGMMGAMRNSALNGYDSDAERGYGAGEDAGMGGSFSDKAVSS